ncbi:hypothetical protein PMALA_020520 [Plasmodium malariae]|uniref:Uncharacterized protein n=1 Tax=Plasmodium malariae TaxID=5858 RepID=A0A1A8W7W4_PLAMA|nr:hypothetical protein PMALA_020520 [Plasmodium malariae]
MITDRSDQMDIEYYGKLHHVKVMDVATIRDYTQNGMKYSVVSNTQSNKYICLYINNEKDVCNREEVSSLLKMGTKCLQNNSNINEYYDFGIIKLHKINNKNCKKVNSYIKCVSKKLSSFSKNIEKVKSCKIFHSDNNKYNKYSHLRIHRMNQRITASKKSKLWKQYGNTDNRDISNILKLLKRRKKKKKKRKEKEKEKLEQKQVQKQRQEQMQISGISISEMIQFPNKNEPQKNALIIGKKQVKDFRIYNIIKPLQHHKWGKNEDVRKLVKLTDSINVSNRHNSNSNNNANNISNNRKSNCKSSEIEAHSNHKDVENISAHDVNVKYVVCKRKRKIAKLNELLVEEENVENNINVKKYNNNDDTCCPIYIKKIRENNSSIFAKHRGVTFFKQDFINNLKKELKRHIKIYIHKKILNGKNVTSYKDKKNNNARLHTIMRRINGGYIQHNPVLFFNSYEFENMSNIYYSYLSILFKKFVNYYLFACKWKCIKGYGEKDFLKKIIYSSNMRYFFMLYGFIAINKFYNEYARIYYLMCLKRDVNICLIRNGRGSIKWGQDDAKGNIVSISTSRFSKLSEQKDGSDHGDNEYNNYDVSCMNRITVDKRFILMGECTDRITNKRKVTPFYTNGEKEEIRRRGNKYINKRSDNILEHVKDHINFDDAYYGNGKKITTRDCICRLSGNNWRHFSGSNYTNNDSNCNNENGNQRESSECENNGNGSYNNSENSNRHSSSGGRNCNNRSNSSSGDNNDENNGGQGSGGRGSGDRGNGDRGNGERGNGDKNNDGDKNNKENKSSSSNNSNDNENENDTKNGDQNGSKNESQNGSTNGDQNDSKNENQNGSTNGDQNGNTNERQNGNTNERQNGSTHEGQNGITNEGQNCVDKENKQGNNNMSIQKNEHENYYKLIREIEFLEKNENMKECLNKEKNEGTDTFLYGDTKERKLMNAENFIVRQEKGNVENEEEESSVEVNTLLNKETPFLDINQIIIHTSSNCVNQPLKLPLLPEMSHPNSFSSHSPRSINVCSSGSASGGSNSGSSSSSSGSSSSSSNKSSTPKNYTNQLNDPDFEEACDIRLMNTPENMKFSQSPPTSSLHASCLHLTDVNELVLSPNQQMYSNSPIKSPNTPLTPTSPLFESNYNAENIEKVNSNYLVSSPYRNDIFSEFDMLGSFFESLDELENRSDCTESSSNDNGKHGNDFSLDMNTQRTKKTNIQKDEVIYNFKKDNYKKVFHAWCNKGKHELNYDNKKFTSVMEWINYVEELMFHEEEGKNKGLEDEEDMKTDTPLSCFNEENDGHVSDNINSNINGNISGNISGNVSGNISGNVSGNISGNVSGADTIEHMDSHDEYYKDNDVHNFGVNSFNVKNINIYGDDNYENRHDDHSHENNQMFVDAMNSNSHYNDSFSNNNGCRENLLPQYNSAEDNITYNDDFKQNDDNCFSSYLLNNEQLRNNSCGVIGGGSSNGNAIDSNCFVWDYDLSEKEDVNNNNSNSNSSNNTSAVSNSKDNDFDINVVGEGSIKTQNSTSSENIISSNFVG